MHKSIGVFLIAVPVLTFTNAAFASGLSLYHASSSPDPERMAYSALIRELSSEDVDRLVGIVSDKMEGAGDVVQTVVEEILSSWASGKIIGSYASMVLSLLTPMNSLDDAKAINEMIEKQDKLNRANHLIERLESGTIEPHEMELIERKANTV